MTDYIATDTELTAVADAIRSKGGTSASLEWPSGFSSAIAAIPTSGDVPTGTISITANGTYNVAQYASADVSVGAAGSTSDPIRFFDYDGTLVASYSSVPESLPSVPTHAGLTNGSWNYTLQELTTQFNSMGTCDIGANYDTSDGATRLYCHFEEGRLSPVLGICPNGTVTVDWGDNSATDTLTGTSLTTVQTVQHVYAAAGDYVIKLSVNSGSFAFSGGDNIAYILRRSTSDTSYTFRVYAAALRRVEVGANVSIKGDAFYFCANMESISLPSSITSIGTSTFSSCGSLRYISVPQDVSSIGQQAFQNCYSLCHISLPLDVTSIGDSAFNNCYGLKSISMPSGITGIGSYEFSSCRSLQSMKIPSTVESIGSNAFANCGAIASITVPSSVTSIGASAFNSCYGLAECHVKPTAPPTLGSGAFTSIPSDCIIYVPKGSLESYQTANNWSTYSSYMVGE